MCQFIAPAGFWPSAGFYYNAWMISLKSKGGKRASECIECGERLLFLYEIFQIDSNNQTC